MDGASVILPLGVESQLFLLLRIGDHRGQALAVLVFFLRSDKFEALLSKVEHILLNFFILRALKRLINFRVGVRVHRQLFSLPIRIQVRLLV